MNLQVDLIIYDKMSGIPTCGCRVFIKHYWGDIKMKKETNRFTLLTTAAIMMALICVMTMVIKIPTPTKGYVNLGDSFVLLSGWLLGPAYGFFAAGVGSALADLISGYPVYIPGTLVIKGLMAVAAALIPAAISRGKEKYFHITWIAGLIIAEIIMILGYYLYEAFVIGLGFVPALAGVAGNAMQAIAGALGAYFFSAIISRTDIVKSFGVFEFTKGGKQQ